jgi:uncharacterized membrane protein YkvA (DUF1232 family)
MHVTRGAWIVLGVVVVLFVILTLVVAVKFVKRMLVVKRLLAGTGASTSGKWVFWGAIAYWIFPIDLLPDPIYIDDIGVLAGALFFLTRLAKKQETLNNAVPHARRLAEMAARRRRTTPPPIGSAPQTGAPQVGAQPPVK